MTPERVTALATKPRGSRRNLELKAKNPDPARSLARCENLGATACGVLAQLDTYFAVPAGRLKLREQDGSSAQLIAYQRADTPQQRESRYRIIEVDSAAELKAALTECLGIEAVVSKRRRLFTWNGRATALAGADHGGRSRAEVRRAP